MGDTASPIELENSNKIVFALITLIGLNVHKKAIIRGVSLNRGENLVAKFLIAYIVPYDIYLGSRISTWQNTQLVILSLRV